MADSDYGRVYNSPTGREETLLLLARPGDRAAAAYCEDHLAAGRDSDAAPLVVLTDRPGAEATPTPNGRTGAVVVVGDSTRSAVAEPGPFLPPAAPTDPVLATGGLGAVGETVDDCLTTWSAAGHRPVVCVDSISGLLEGAPVEATYRFLYVLLCRIDALGAAVHAHADPHDHEEEILRTFFTLFDRIVSFRDGGASRR